MPAAPPGASDPPWVNPDQLKTRAADPNQTVGMIRTRSLPPVLIHSPQWGATGRESRMNEAREGARGRDRREFLKKAGAVAWVVPTMQVVNMAAAAAGVAGSAVPPPPPPPSTSQGPGCRTCRLRAVWEPGRGFVWTDGAVEQGDCLGLPADAEISNGASVGARIEGDGTELIVRLLYPWRCRIRLPIGGRRVQPRRAG